LNDRLLELPLGVFSWRSALMILPSLSRRHHVSTESRWFLKALDWGLRTALLISLPQRSLALAARKPHYRDFVFCTAHFKAARCQDDRIEFVGAGAGLPAFTPWSRCCSHPAFY
jgi:putative peptidoglycan lipid II flippase